MSRPISSQNSVSISLDQPIDQDALNKVKTFKKSLGPNDRVLVNRSGNTTIYTQHKESASEKFSRKLDNFEKNVKTAWSHVSDLLSIKNQGNESGATKNIKDTPIQKSPSSISAKQFNLDITPIINTCTIPVLDDLTNHRGNLNDLERMIGEMNIDYSLGIFSTGSQSLEKVGKEFSAFVQFAQAQGRGESVTHQDKGAINFANRWTAIPYGSDERYALNARFGESYKIIDKAAVALAAFDKS